MDRNICYKSDHADHDHAGAIRSDEQRSMMSEWFSCITRDEVHPMILIFMLDQYRVIRNRILEELPPD